MTKLRAFPLAKARRLYLRDGWTTARIGAEVGWSDSEVRRRLRGAGVQILRRHLFPASPPYHSGELPTRRRTAAREARTSPGRDPLDGLPDQG